MPDIYSLKKILKKNKYAIRVSNATIVEYLHNPFETMFPIVGILLIGFQILVMGASIISLIILFLGFAHLVVYMIDGSKNKIPSIIKFLIKKEGIVYVDNQSNKYSLAPEDLGDFEIITNYNQKNGICLKIKDLKTNEDLHLIECIKTSKKLEETLQQIAQIAVDTWEE